MSEALDTLGEHITEIRLRINSPGGEVFEGLAILNMLRAHPAKVVAVVDGLAASAAAFVAAGCDETVMSPGTQLMIHDARSFVYGPPAVLREYATVLDSISDGSAEVLAEAAGGTEAAWRALMVAETWYTAREAVAASLADRVGVVADAGPTTTAGAPDVPETSDDVEERFDLSIYQYAGRSHAPAPTFAAAAATTRPPAASAGGSPSIKEGATLVDFTDEQIATLREQVGFPENADATVITDAVVEALSERAEPTAATQLPEGMVAIPAVALTELQTNGRAGAAAAERLRIQERDQFLNSHRDRFTPAARQAWEKQYDLDPKGTREYLEKADVIVPLEEIGHDVPSPEGTSSDDSWFASFPLPAGVTQEA